MTDAVTRPDEHALLAHVETPRFQQGVDDGRWRIVELAWPTAVIAVRAAPRTGAPTEYMLRFDLNGYPQVAPTAGLWDCSAGAYLSAEKRPKGDRAVMAFRGDWEGGRALYVAWDRVALNGHPDWAQRYPHHAWHSRRDLTFYLINVAELLNADDYVGV